MFLSSFALVAGHSRRILRGRGIAGAGPGEAGEAAPSTLAPRSADRLLDMDGIAVQDSVERDSNRTAAERGGHHYVDSEWSGKVKYT